MILDKRSKEILAHIVKSHSYINLKDIQDRFSISRRTVYYNITKINDWLKNNNQREILNIHGKGLTLDSETKKFIYDYFTQSYSDSYIYSKQERIAIIFILLTCFDKLKFTIEEISELMKVSKSTIYNDINNLKEDLKQYNLTLNFTKSDKYKIIGNERNIRSALFSFISTMTKKGKIDYKFLTDVIYLNNRNIGKCIDVDNEEKIQKMLNSIEQDLSISFVDSTYSQLVQRINLTITRIKFGETINLDDIEIKTLKETYEYKGALELSKKIENEFKVKISIDEIAYLTILILTSKIKRNDINLLINEDIKKLDSIIDKMISEFELLACISFSDKEILKENLFLHLKPTYYRLKNGIKIQNSLGDTIKKKYKEIYNLTEIVSKHFNELTGKKMPEGELSYIAVHFGAWVQKARKDLNKAKNIILVCPEGIGVSRILENQLLSLFDGMNFNLITMSVREYNRIIKINGELVISTVLLKDKKVPIYIVNSILSDDEKQKLSKYIFRFFSIKEKMPKMKTIIDIISKHAEIKNEEKLICELTEHLMMPHIYFKEVQPVLNELITSDRIQIIDKVQNWEECIKKAAQPLVVDGCIEERYIDAMIDSVKELGPYIVIAPDIAIPHARPEMGVKNTGMSFLKLKEAVSFSDDSKHDAKLIFVLASKDNREHLKALRQLTRMLSDKNNVLMLKGDIQKEDIIELLTKHSVMD